MSPTIPLSAKESVVKTSPSSPLSVASGIAGAGEVVESRRMSSGVREAAASEAVVVPERLSVDGMDEGGMEDVSGSDGAAVSAGAGASGKALAKGMDEMTGVSISLLSTKKEPVGVASVVGVIVVSAAWFVLAAASVEITISDVATSAAVVLSGAKV